jgi:hypothetical protein
MAPDMIEVISMAISLFTMSGVFLVGSFNWKAFEDSLKLFELIVVGIWFIASQFWITSVCI